MASLCSTYFNLFSISIGASGAIFGLYAFLFLMEWQEIRTERTSLIINFILFLILNLAFGNWLNIDNYAHIGGFLSGFFIFYLFKQSNSIALCFLIWAIPLAGFFFAPKVQKKYYDVYQYMLQKDGHILSAINSYYLSQDEQAEKIEVIQTLPDSIKLKFAQIKNLPEELQNDTLIINTFFSRRSQEIHYFLKLLKNDSYLYKDSILYIRNIMKNSFTVTHRLNFNNSSKFQELQFEGENNLTITKEFYDENWDVTPLVYKAKFYRIGTKDSLGRWHGEIVDYFADDTPQMKGTYKRDLKDGIFIYYNEDGTYDNAGIYRDDSPVGKWESYYKNNKLHTEFRHENGYIYVESILDTLGNYIIKNGEGQQILYHKNGIIRYKRTIAGGLNHGVMESFYENGDLYFREYHNNGDLEYGISYDSLGNSYRYESENEWPYPKGGLEELYNYFLRENKMLTPTTKEYVHLKFLVKKDGQISDIKIISGISQEADQYAINLLHKGPKWYAARYRGFIKGDREAEVYVPF